MVAPAAVFRHYLPCRELRPYVCGYMSLAFEGEEPERTIDRFFPDGTSETRFHSADPMLTRALAGAYPSITFNFGDPWRLQKESTDPMTLRNSWVMGAMTRPGLLSFGRNAGALGVMFQAGQAQHFLRADAVSLTDAIVGLDDLWGPSARALTARLAELATAAERIHALEEELLRRLRTARPVGHGVHRIAGLIEREHGAVSVERLSRVSGMSRQHLARTFRRQIGLTPKHFCRMVRFHALLTRAYLEPPVQWAALAADHGYYDQAHLIAEFKEFTGLTPGQYFPPRANASRKTAKFHSSKTRLVSAT